MNRPANSLYPPLLQALLWAIFGLCVLQFCYAVVATRNVSAETAQRINWDVAEALKRELQGALVDGIDPNKLGEPLVLFHEINPPAEMYLLDSRGKVLFSSPLADISSSFPVEVAPLEAALSPATPKLPLFATDPRTGVPNMLFSVARIVIAGKPSYLYVVIRDDVRQEMVQWGGFGKLARLLAPPFLLAALAGVIGLVALSLYLTAQFRALAKAALAFAQGDYRIRVPVKSKDDVGYLSEAFNRMAQSITDKEEELVEVESRRRGLIANIAHDLRTPLTSIQGFLETMLLRKGELPEDEQQRFDQIISRSVERQQDLLDNLYELSELEAEEREPRFAPLSLATLGREVVAALEPLAREKSIEICCKVEGLEHQINADQRIIERVVTNLITNAIRYTPSGGSVTVTVLEASDGARLSVADTGIGIPAEALPHIFEDFFRVKQSDAEHSGGTGLGLAIVKRMLDLHGADIKVESELGKGTTFSFLISNQPRQPVKKSGPALVPLMYSHPSGSFPTLPALPALAQPPERPWPVFSTAIMFAVASTVIALSLPMTVGLEKALSWYVGALSLSVLHLIAVQRGRKAVGASKRWALQAERITSVLIAVAMGYALTGVLPDRLTPSRAIVSGMIGSTFVFANLFFRQDLLQRVAVMVVLAVSLSLGPYISFRWELYVGGAAMGAGFAAIVASAFPRKQRQSFNHRFAMLFGAVFLLIGYYQTYRTVMAWRTVMYESDRRIFGGVIDYVAHEVEQRIASNPDKRTPLLAWLFRIAQLNPKIDVLIADQNDFVEVQSMNYGGVDTLEEGERLDYDRIANDILLPSYPGGGREAVSQHIFFVRELLSLPDPKQVILSILSGRLYLIRRKLDEIYVMNAIVITILSVILFSNVNKYLVLGKLRRRFSQLVDVMQQLDRGDYLVRAPVSVGDEIDQIGSALNTMADVISRKVEALQIADGQRRALVRAIADSMKAPLYSMKDAIQRIAYQRSEGNRNQSLMLLGEVQKAVRAQYQLVEDLFEFSKLEMGEVQSAAEPCPLGEVLQDVLLTAGERSAARGVEIVCPGIETLPFVEIDIGLFARAVEILVDYAVLRSPDGSSVSIRGEIGNGKVKLCIQDRGAHIPPTDLSNPVVSVFSSKEGLTYSIDCNPLRLAIARRLLELHHTSVSIDHVSGVGSLLSFEVPLEAH